MWGLDEALDVERMGCFELYPSSPGPDDHVFVLGDLVPFHEIGAVHRPRFGSVVIMRMRLWVSGLSK